jgi:large repetitive protein
MLHRLSQRDGVRANALQRLLCAFFSLRMRAATHTKHQADAWPHSRGKLLSTWMWLVVLTGIAMWPAWARANECPTFNETVASGQSVEFNVLSCSPNGVESVTQPSHGTASIDGADVSGNILYTNDGKGTSTTDQFTFQDDKNETIEVDITIGTPTYPPIVISPSAGTLTGGNVGQSYTLTFTSTGGDGGPYTYNISNGNLPNGLNFSGGTISGTPTESGAFSFTVTSEDSHNDEQSQSYSLNISGGVLSVTPASAPAGNLYATYPSFTMSASGGTAPYTYTYGNTGSLPPGISFNAGTFSGTPTQTGTFTYAVNVADSAGNSERVDYTFTINPPVITLSPTSLPDGTQTVNYNQQLSASGGNPSGGYTFSVSSGSLPPGVTLSSSGLLSGAPTTASSYTFSVVATDSSPSPGPYSSSPQPYTLKVDPDLPTITTTSLAAGTVGVSYSQQISVTNGQTPYQFSATGLPAGLQINGTTGLISGTPTASGSSFSVTVKVTDKANNSATQTYPMSIGQPTITLSPATLNGMTTGVAFSQTVTASGGTPFYQYTVTAGALPGGLSLDSHAGIISGTPTVEGPYNFTVTATDSTTGNGPYTGTQAYSGTITGPAIVISPSGSALSASYGQAYSQTFTASGGTAPYTFSMSATSIPGLSWNASTATLSGTPTQPGNYPITITAVDHTGGTGPATFSQNYTLTVGTASISITPSSLPSGSVGVAYTNTTLSASGGIAPYTYSLSLGSLPTGLALSSSGVISGTPTSAGNFSFTVVATDHNGATGTQAYSNVSIGSATITLTPSSPILPAATAEAVYSETFSSSGGTAPYQYSITSGALPPGLTLSSAGVLNGTPTAAGAYNFTVQSLDHSTGTGAPFFTSRAYSLTVNAPVVTISPSTLPGAQVAVAYSQQLTASGGNGSYTFSVSAGSLPTGLSLSTSGLLSGTPSVAGSYNFTVTAKDSLNFSGSQAYTVSTQQPKPVAVNDTASTSANQAVTINVTSVDTGPITSIAIASAPTHGTASVSGLAIVYTPTQNFYGTDTLSYTATGPGGTSAAATVTITVTPLAVPTVTAQNVTVLAGNTVSINPTTGATGGPFTATSIVKAPSSGTATVSGNAINYSAPETASGLVTFSYTLTNAFGVSQPATVTVTIDPRPIIAPQNISSIAGRAAQINLTQGATGGPFTAATLVSLSPSSAGNASIVPISGGYQLNFTSSPTFSGAAIVTYTLSNAYATSAPGTITITVAARPDPSKDPEVLGVLNAQADATREFAQGQIENFQQRLESLHGGAGGGNGGFQNNLTFMSGDSNNPGLPPQWPTNNAQNMAGNLNRRYMVDPQTQANPTTTSSSPLPDGYVLWTGGAVNFGSRDTTATASGFDFTTAGISVGLDKRFSETFATGVGAGYGHDDTEIGHNGSSDTANSYNIAWYASFSPSPSTFIDGLLGYQWLSFNAHRYVTADGNTVYGGRDGHQAFASISAGYEYHSDAWLISPYGRFDIASARLDRYTEQGDAIYALSYGSELVKTTTASLGLRMNYIIKEDYGTVMPQLRIEYGHDFQGSSQATMTYADLLAGPVYRAQVDQLTQNHFLIGIGLNWELARKLTIRLEYENEINAGDQNDQSVLINVQKKF